MYNLLILLLALFPFYTGRWVKSPLSSIFPVFLFRFIVIYFFCSFYRPVLTEPFSSGSSDEPLLDIILTSPFSLFYPLFLNVRTAFAVSSVILLADFRFQLV